jgi:hypothetical protein
MGSDKDCILFIKQDLTLETPDSPGSPIRDWRVKQYGFD